MATGLFDLSEDSHRHGTDGTKRDKDFRAKSCCCCTCFQLSFKFTKSAAGGGYRLPSYKQDATFAVDDNGLRSALLAAERDNDFIVDAKYVRRWHCPNRQRNGPHNLFGSRWDSGHSVSEQVIAILEKYLAGTETIIFF